MTANLAKKGPCGHTYTWRGEVFDSVTTIISGGVPKPALINWAARSVAEFAVGNLATLAATAAEQGPDAAVELARAAPSSQRDAAGAVGTAVHAWAEAHALGAEPAPPTAAQRPYLDALNEFWRDWRPVYVGAEMTVYNRQWGYAGTLDAVLDMAGARWLLDAKTGKGVYGEVALQLAAYRSAEFVGLPDGTEAPMPQVDRCAVLHLRPEGYRLVPVTAGPDELASFLYAQQVRIFLARAPSLVGAPLGPPVPAVVAS